MSSVNESEGSTSTSKPNTLISDELRVILQWVTQGGLLPIISIFGVASNIINIICFVRQGLKDPVNVSLLGLAISDLIGLTNSICISVCYTPVLDILDLPVDMVDFAFLACGPLMFLFTGLTSWITALITLERCFCITMPIKVKSVINPERVMIILLCLFITFTCSASSLYFVGELAWEFSPERNRTILRLVFAKNGVAIEQVSYMVNGTLIPFSAYITIIICTVILIAKLRTKSKWRKTCTTSTSADNTSKRDQKVARMVISISTLFIGCYTPMCALLIVIMTVPALSLFGSNNNVVFIMGGVNVVLQSANSSANIFFYYHMSSRYQSMFRDLFRSNVVGSKADTVRKLI